MAFCALVATVWIIQNTIGGSSKMNPLCWSVLYSARKKGNEEKCHRNWKWSPIIAYVWAARPDSFANRWSELAKTGASWILIKDETSRTKTSYFLWELRTENWELRTNQFVIFKNFPLLLSISHISTFGMSDVAGINRMVTRLRRLSVNQEGLRLSIRKMKNAAFSKPSLSPPPCQFATFETFETRRYKVWTLASSREYPSYTFRLIYPSLRKLEQTYKHSEQTLVYKVFLKAQRFICCSEIINVAEGVRRVTKRSRCGLCRLRRSVSINVSDPRTSVVSV